MRLLEVMEPTNKKEMSIFDTLNKREAEVKNLSIGGIPGIKTAKIAKRFLMNAPLSAKTNMSNDEKANYEYVVF